MVKYINQIGYTKQRKNGGDNMRADIDGVKRDVVSKGLEILGDKVYKIILFGSYARGDYEEDSDVDIMMLLDCKRKELPQYRQMLSGISGRISLNNNVTVSLLLNDKDTFYSKKNIMPFYQNVERDGVILFGR